MTAHPAPVSRLFAGTFPAIEERLLSRLPETIARGGDWEHVLLVPSNDLREHLLRRLAARWDGVAARVSIMTLYDFTIRLLKHRGMFPRELPQAVMSAAFFAAVRQTYEEGSGDFAAISSTPGFLPALQRTLSDLEEGWLDAEVLRAAEMCARKEGRPGKASRWAEWRALVEEVERKVHAMGGMTRRRIFREAVSGFEHPGYPFRVSLYGFYDFTRLQWTLVDALLSSGLLDEVYFPGIFREDGSLSPSFFFAAHAWDRLLRAFEGNFEFREDPVPPALHDARERIFSTASPDTLAPAPVTILSPPHEEGEARLAARHVRRWLDEHPGEEVMLVYRRLDEAGVSAWERAAKEYDIPTVERLAVPLSSVPLVRVLLQMIEAAREDFPRRKTMDILSSPYRRHSAASAAVAPRPDFWDVWTRELLVVSGKDWDARLFGLRPRDAEEAESDSWKEKERQLRLLRGEVKALRASMAPVWKAGGYAGFGKALRRLLIENFRFLDDESAEAERDRRALSDLFSILDEVEQVPDRAAPWPGTDDAVAWFAALLESRRLFVGKRGGMRLPGVVTAGDLNALRGVTADRVIFLSVDDGSVPAQIDEDPLLPDEDRETLNRLTRRPELPDALSLLRRNAAQEKLLFSLPVISARREVCFSVPRADSEGAVKRPSRYLLNLLSRFAGPGVFGEEWTAKSGAKVRFLPRSPFAMLRADGPLSRREEALRAWSEGVPPKDGADGIPWRRIAAILSEWESRWSGTSLFPERRIVPPRPDWSATELDELARCPYRYFLRYRLGLSPVEEPEEELSLTPAEAGLILHDILHRLGKEAAAGKGWGDAASAARKAFIRFARENPTGLPGLFLLRCREIERDAAVLVEWERGRAERPEAYRVEDVELRFKVPAGRTLPAFRGRVDRVDRGPRGEAEIIDYKYGGGKDEKPPLERILHGLASQIPVYLSFARTLSPPPPEIRATLLFLKDGVTPVTVVGEQWKAVQEGWASSLSEWIGLERSGTFPPLPHDGFTYAGAKSPRYCDACLFADHCRVSPRYEGAKKEKESLVRRVIEDPALRAIGEHRPAAG
ncbi:MAG: PD-(D/E)XK nuclease family protein [Deltaproteobacteria bacterium]|nr:PD-(D/E)XK nuclease family protein [Deltaproteobacteria bacterium]